VWRFVEVAYFRAPQGNVVTRREAPLGMLIPAWMLVGAAVFFGLETSITVGSAANIAAMLLGSVK
jgi:multicomponent Na+:H+ antiporter subunit D